MSLYTPVFPHADARAGRNSSATSLTSVESHEQSRVLSYSSRLSQWHLAVASLSDELCPPSAPSSPSSQARSAKLRSEIEQAVHDGRNITDFCKLRSSKIGYSTTHLACVSVEQGDDVPWILAETEEEWFDWERKMAQRRPSGQKGKEPMTTVPPPPSIQSQSAHDKVLSWKARLEPINASSVPPAASNHSLLSFPVVKRSLLRKDSKTKESRSAFQIDSAPRLSSILPTVGEQSPALRADTRPIDAVRVDTGDVVHGNSFTGLKLTVSNSSPETREATTFGDAENASPELREFPTFPPSSFPSDLPTSTQKNEIRQAWSACGPPPSFPLNLLTSTPRDAADPNEIIKADMQQEPLIGRPPAPGDGMPRNELGSSLPEQQAPQPSPPTPPYSSETSQPPDAPTRISDRQTPVTPPNKHARPLTPPPEDMNPTTIGMQSSPRTPKQHRAGLYTSPSGIGRSSRGGNVKFNGHITPDAAINGVSVLRDALGVHLAYPRTPERDGHQQGQSLPDPLTTSRKSRPRPRPPSRKHSMQGMDVDGAEGGGDPSPAKSDRSYFSSPASGSSSGSEPGSVRGGLVVPGSPTSPLGLGLGFSQNPGRFAPLAESTQALQPDSGSPRRSRTRPEGGSGSLNSKFLSSQSLSSRSQQGQSQKNGLSMYNSQFDVDARVDQLSHFMHRDVDLNAWVLDSSNANTDEEAEEGAVEEMTMTYPEAANSLGS